MAAVRALLGMLLCSCLAVACSPSAAAPASPSLAPTACSSPLAQPPQAQPRAEVALAPALSENEPIQNPPCDLPTVVPPTPPAAIPGYAELDPATGLHVTGGAALVDLGTYELRVTGKVAQPQRLTYDALRCLPRVALRCTLVCPGYFEDDAEWAGTPLAGVLDMAGVSDGASGLRLKSADGYVTLVSLHAARAESALLAYEWEGEPLPVLHGFPVRAVFPNLEGNRWAKWLEEIEVY